MISKSSLAVLLAFVVLGLVVSGLFGAVFPQHVTKSHGSPWGTISAMSATAGKDHGGSPTPVPVAKVSQILRLAPQAVPQAPAPAPVAAAAASPPPAPAPVAPAAPVVAAAAPLPAAAPVAPTAAPVVTSPAATAPPAAVSPAAAQARAEPAATPIANSAVAPNANVTVAALTSEGDAAAQATAEDQAAPVTEAPAAAAPVAPAPAAAQAAPAVDQKSAAKPRTGTAIDINKAPVEVLNHLPGVGRIGRAIVRHRPYRSIQDLVDRRVLRMSAFQKVKALIKAD